MPTKTVPKSGVVNHKTELCRSCKICELVCSASHEGVCGSYLSRIHIDADDLNFNFSGQICSQCESAQCYFACPLKDIALCTDSATGARYINEDECTGCGACAEACQLPEPPIWEKTQGGKAVFFKCDLCKDTKEGPLCVVMCPWGALKFVNKEDRLDG